MKFIVDGVFTGSETRTSKKTGNSYEVVMFVSGMESLTLMVKDSCTFEGITSVFDLQQFKPYTFTLDFNVQYSQMTISGITAQKSK